MAYMYHRNAPFDPQCSDRCESYDTFQDLHREILTKYACLNPMKEPIPELMKPGSAVELNESGMEFIRGGIVALMTAWENYVHELFDEAFDTLIDICSGQGRSLQRLEEQWPACETIIKREMKEACKEMKENCKDKGETKKEKTAYDLMKDTDQGPEKMWMKLLDEHRRTILHQRTLQPIFNYMANPKDNAMTIDGLFMKLFEATRGGEKISDMLVNVAQTNYFRLYLGDRDVMVTLHPVDKSAVKALRNISRLYYGFRCISVHGRKEKTLKGGALSEFPEKEEDFPFPEQDDKDVKVKKYMRLYKRIEENGRKAHVSYLTFLNVANFIRYAAIYLMQAVAKWIYEKQSQDSPRISVWGYTFPTSNDTAKPN